MQASMNEWCKHWTQNLLLLNAFIKHYYPLSSRLNALLSHVILNESLAFYSAFLNGWWLVPHETAAVLARSVYTTQPCTVSHHFMQSHIHRVLMCLAVTCQLHFWQNDKDLLRATAVTWR